MNNNPKRYFSLAPKAEIEDDVTYLDDKNEKVISRNTRRLTAAAVMLIICCTFLYYTVDWKSTEFFIQSKGSSDTFGGITSNEIKNAGLRKGFSPECLYSIPQPDLRQHIVTPPSGPVTLVCCNTTKGTLNIEVHTSWAPIGAERFLHMVNNGFFSTKVGLFRALKGFLVQFGLAGIWKTKSKSIYFYNKYLCRRS